MDDHQETKGIVVMEIVLPLRREYFPLGIFILVVAASALVVFPFSFLLRGNFLFGLAIFPWVILSRGPVRLNYWLLALIAIFTAAVWMYQVRMFYFFVLVFSILLAIEFSLGRVHKLVYLLVLVMSPFFSQLTVILGFNFRMKLSQFAGYLMQRTGLDVAVEGNTILLRGNSFTVDDACAGLNMLAISFLTGIFLVSYCARAAGRNISSIQLLLYFTIVVALNLISNLIRIILLVFFEVLPENPMHEVLGLVSFFVYVAVPLYWCTPRWVRRFGKIQDGSDERFCSSRSQYVCMILLFVAIIPTGIFLHGARSASPETTIVDVRSAEMVAMPMKNGITRFSGDDVLIYVKSIPEFFSGEHTPLFCWRGSGYTFSKIQESEINGRMMYIGELTKGDEILHTAWWYSNGRTETTSQFEWRWKMFADQDRFYLINVTSATQPALIDNINCTLEKDFFNIAFHE
jgi:exosortase N